MRFYGDGIVWDRRIAKPLCRFSKRIKMKKDGIDGWRISGFLDTDDPYIIKKLYEYGYRYDGKMPPEILDSGKDFGEDNPLHAIAARKKADEIRKKEEAKIKRDAKKAEKASNKQEVDDVTG